MQIITNVQFFPFEHYIHSCDEKEHSRDAKRKNHLMKYISLLAIDTQDKVSFNKLCMSMLFFRNNFTRDSFLEFFNYGLKEEEKYIIGNIVFDMFVRSKKGQIGENKELLKYAIKTYKYVKYKGEVNEYWENFKKEHEDFV